MCRVPDPVIVERDCGGYLAVSPRWARIKIGVTAPFREAAKDLFAIRYAEWLEILKQ